MSDDSFNDNDDTERSLLKRAGLPECFGSKRDSIDRSYCGGDQRRGRGSNIYRRDRVMPTTKYDLMTADERRDEQARIGADVKQVSWTRMACCWVLFRVKYFEIDWCYAHCRPYV